MMPLYKTRTSVELSQSMAKGRTYPPPECKQQASEVRVRTGWPPSLQTSALGLSEDARLWLGKIFRISLPKVLK